MEGVEKESGSERRRRKKDESKGENASQDIKVESEGSGRRTYNRMKKEEKKDEDDEKKLSHRNMRKNNK